jgi:hypothetical protein
VNQDQAAESQLPNARAADRRKGMEFGQITSTKIVHMRLPTALDSRTPRVKCCFHHALIDIASVSAESSVISVFYDG